MCVVDSGSAASAALYGCQRVESSEAEELMVRHRLYGACDESERARSDPQRLHHEQSVRFTDAWSHCLFMYM